MPFANERVTRITFFTEHFRAKVSMTNIFVSAVTINIRRETTDYAYIVKHGGFFDKPEVKIHFRMRFGY
jgi:hypothetical protein